MKAGLRMFWHFLRAFWWVLVLVIVAVLVGIIYLVNKKKRKQIEQAAGDNAPSLVAEAYRHVQEAATDVRVERAVIAADTEHEKEEVEAIRKEPNGTERRKRLAKYLQDSI